MSSLLTTFAIKEQQLKKTYKKIEEKPNEKLRTMSYNVIKIIFEGY